MPDKNFIKCRNYPLKLLIPLMGQFHFMTEPTFLMWDPALNEICPAYSEIRPAFNEIAHDLVEMDQ